MAASVFSVIMAAMDSGADAEPAEPCNEDLAREMGLHFSDFSQVERDILLRARAASVSAHAVGERSLDFVDGRRGGQSAKRRRR